MNPLIVMIGAILIGDVAAKVPATGDVIRSVHVQGLQRIPQETVTSVLKLQPNQLVTASDLNKMVKTVYALGFFGDVSVRLDKGVLVIRVSENPTINQVVFEGNHEVTEKDLKIEMKIRPKAIYDANKVQGEVIRLLAIYRAKGYFAARVAPKVIQQSQNRVDVIFEIDEGDPAKIAAINFVGNNEFSDWTLRSTLKTEESAWWKFFSTADTFDPDKLEMDKEELRKFYLNQGYVDFRLLSATAELMPKYDNFILTFHIEEGARYKFGELGFENNIAHLPLEVLEKAQFLQEGSWYSVGLVERVMENIIDAANAAGFPFVEVNPVPTVDTTTHQVGIRFVVQESPRVFVNRITITGNDRTIDPVLRRRMIVAEGDANNVSKIRSSKHLLENLGYFKNIDITERPVPGRPDLVDLNVAVTEQGTGDISLRGGYVTSEGFMGQLGYNERNLFGRGYNFGTTLQASAINKSFNVNFVNPYLFNRNLTGGIDVFAGRVNKKKFSSYESTNYGAKGWVAYNIRPYLTQTLGYGISQSKVTRGGMTVNQVFPLILEDNGTFTSSSVQHVLDYSRLDNPILPRSGYSVSLSTTFTGVGGNTRTVKNIFSLAYYYPVTTAITLGLSAQYGNIIGLGQHVRTADKFVLGGNTLRGFDYEGVGPRPKSNLWDESLGGDNLFTASAQLNFPLGLPDDLAISGLIFLDVGTLWDSKLQKRIDNLNAMHWQQPYPLGYPLEVYNDKGFRSSVGVGILWSSPMGLIGVNYGIALSSKPGDQKRAFMLQLGTGRF